MIFLVTQWVPAHKSLELAEKFFKIGGKPLPPVIKKWNIFGTDDGVNGLKTYHLIKTEKDKGDEAMNLIRELMVPFFTIEGVTIRIEILYGMQETARLMKFFK